MKRITRRLTVEALSLATACSLVACGSSTSVTTATSAKAAETGSSSANAETKFIPGTYTGSSKGHSGDVTVTATFNENEITDVKLDVSGETESIGQAAADTLKSSILEKQSADFDAVSGATETSDAVKRALQAAIDQATGKGAAAEKTALKAGTYTESVPSYGFTGNMVGDVTIKDGKISDIKITSETDSLTSQWYSIAEEKMIPRILEAQSVGIDAVTGATTSSGAIKSLVAKAIEDAGGKADEWYTVPAKSTEVKKLEGYDVIVVGLGGSGILSYCAAAQSGAKVFGIEAAAGIGGNSASVYGPMAINSKNLAAKYNNGKDYIDAEDVYKTWMEYVESDKKADIIRKAVDASGPDLDYYMDHFDFSFDGLGGLLGSFVRKDWDKEWTVYTADGDNKKWYILGPDHTFQFQHALDKAKAMKEGNDYMLELRANKLLTDADGNITGVSCTAQDGTTYEVYGKNVILATGGFVGNDEMMKKYLGSTVHVIGDLVNKGDGIRMAQDLGAATYAMGTLPMIHVSQVPNIIRTDDLTADQKAILSALALTTDVPEITTEGKKWGADDASGTDASTGLTVGIAYAPGYMYYNVWSQKAIDEIRTKGLSETTAKANVNFIGNGGTLPEAGTPVTDIDKILEVGEKYKDILSGNVKELSDKMKVDVKTLAETLGVSEDSEDKFYLAACAGWSYGTVGGLDVDINMNVLKEDGTAFPNLYAVGQDSEGVCNVDGKAYSPWGGQAQSWTFVSGRTAGEHAAKNGK